jgi:hypothetical protein
MVLSCSALKRRYRDLLRSADPELRFAHLAGPRELIAERMAARKDHYMPATLLDSQLATLEPLQDDEAGIVLDIRQPAGRAGAADSQDLERCSYRYAKSNVNQHLTWREKISYGIADMGFNFYWTNVATFLLIYYTDVFGISAAAAASMMFTIKIINAFTDPMIGAARIAPARAGASSALVWLPLPLACAAFLTYTTPNLSEDGKILWAYGTYLCMMVCYTCINIPYNALSGVLSADAQERSTVNGLRFIFALPAARW